MKIYVSRKDENVTAELNEAYSNEHTVMLKYLTGDKAGKTTSITHSTLKRWWKVVEIEDTVEDIDETNTNIESSPDKDSKEQEETSVDIMTITRPIVEVVNKPMKKTKKVSRIDRTKEILELDAFIGNTYNNKYYESVKCYKIIKNDKTVAEIYPRKKEIEVRVKSIKDNFDSDIRYKDGYKYYLPVHYFLDYTSDYIKLISDLIQ